MRILLILIAMLSVVGCSSFSSHIVYIIDGDKVAVDNRQGVCSIFGDQDTSISMGDAKISAPSRKNTIGVLGNSLIGTIGGWLISRSPAGAAGGAVVGTVAGMAEKKDPQLNSTLKTLKAQGKLPKELEECPVVQTILRE